MKGTAGKLMYETLRNYGVTHLFGLDEPVHVTQALDKDVIKPITVRDENNGRTATRSRTFFKETSQVAGR